MGRLTKSDLISIAPPDKYKFAVETGTWKGKQLEILTQVYDKVYGIELDSYYAQLSLRNAPRAKKIYVGDSRKWLKHITRHKYLNVGLFLLDAHYCKLDPPINKSQFPLWEELEILSKRSCKDVIIVDDVHTFGKERNDLRYKEKAREWESVTPDEIMKYFPGSKSEIIKDSFVIWK